MEDFTTEIAKCLCLDGKSFKEYLRGTVEKALNELLQAELSAFLGYEKYEYDGRGSGDSRNGSYERTVNSQFGELHITVPRDRNGDFKQKTIPEYTRRTDSLEQTVIQLYSHGMTTGDIADVIEKMYGCYYSKTTVSNITETMTDFVTEFHSKPIQEKYAVIYCDATYLNLRRDTVSPEALHIILGITADGKKEVLDYALFPSETAQNYRSLLEKLKERGMKQVLLFVSDGLTGLHKAINEVYPEAKYQSCWVHLSRTVGRHIRKKDRSEILNALKEIYSKGNADDARKELTAFLEKYSERYPKLKSILEDQNNLFTFYDFPKEIRRSIYSTNLIERCNKALKSGYKKKEQFPNEQSLERYVSTVLSDYNKRYTGLSHHGFGAAEEALTGMFK